MSSLVFVAGSARVHAASDDPLRFHGPRLVARAVQAALADARLALDDVLLLAASSPEEDHGLPGIAARVQAVLGARAARLASFHGVCGNGLAVLRSAWLEIAHGSAGSAVACAFEPGRGASAVVLGCQRRKVGSTLALAWLEPFDAAEASVGDDVARASILRRVADFDAARVRAWLGRARARFVLRSPRSRLSDAALLAITRYAARAKP